MDTREIEQAIDQLKNDFKAIHMARPPFVLEKFVVGVHANDSPAQGWAHCVLELKLKYNALRRATLGQEKIKLEIERLEATGDELDAITAQEQRLDLEDQASAMLGAAREFEALYKIYQGFGRRYTRAELDEAQAGYWQARLERQARADVLATGAVSQSNQEALGQIGAGLETINDRIARTQAAYLAEGNRRLLIVVPTEAKASEGLPVVEGLEIPSGVECRIHNIYGMAVDAAYNEAVMLGLQDKADYLLTVEDDTYPPASGLAQLLEHNLDVVGGWYPKRNELAEGVPIEIANGRRRAMASSPANCREVYTIPNGFTLFKLAIFRVIPYPWFVTTPQLSQDSYFSQQAREAGYALFVDSSIRCRHIDRETGVEYA